MLRMFSKKIIIIIKNKSPALVIGIVIDCNLNIKKKKCKFEKGGVKINE